MSRKANWPNSKGLKKSWDDKTIYLGEACDLTNGSGWHSQVHCDYTFEVGYGFHTTNKFTAVRLAMDDLSKVSQYPYKLSIAKKVDQLINKG